MRRLLHKLPQKKHVVRGIFFIASLAFFYAGVTAVILAFNRSVSIKTILLSSNATSSAVFEILPEVPVFPPVAHVQTPVAVKAAYMSSCIASTPSERDRVINIINTTEINSIVIDVKDATGRMSYKADDSSLLSDGKTGCRISDMRRLISLLHRDNVYVIGRVAVFQDPYRAERNPELAVKSKTTGGLWEDRKGMTWVDPNSKEVWEYTVAIAKDAYSQGFDEINFDYIRFPSDGNIQDMVFPLSGTSSKPIIIKSFFEYLNSQMKTAGIPTSADVFGMTTTVTGDLNIGQVLESALLNFDYVSPMVYPSHYPKGFDGWANPNAHPYDLVLSVMKAGSDRAITAGATPLKLRPWLQDFSLGSPAYGKREVEDQIRATYDAGLTSWMLWDPSNKYAGGALLRE
ncbi:MAG: putative glycoside hydrolase [Candidatus Paceibacterota bacterium]|jgi:hypothetical protein